VFHDDCAWSKLLWQEMSQVVTFDVNDVERVIGCGPLVQEAAGFRGVAGRKASLRCLVREDANWEAWFRSVDGYAVVVVRARDSPDFEINQRGQVRHQGGVSKPAAAGCWPGSMVREVEDVEFPTRAR